MPGATTLAPGNADNPARPPPGLTRVGHTRMSSDTSRGDRPFGGIIDVAPTAITEAERQATRNFLAHHPATDLPCDGNGIRRTA